MLLHPGSLSLTPLSDDGGGGGQGSPPLSFCIVIWVKMCLRQFEQMKKKKKSVCCCSVLFGALLDLCSAFYFVTELTDWQSFFSFTTTTIFSFSKFFVAKRARHLSFWLPPTHTRFSMVIGADTLK